MPSGLPPFPSQPQAIRYLHSYAKRFELEQHIHFEAEVERASPLTHGWEVKLVHEQSPRVYRGLVVASGHHWHPRMPSWEGEFNGRVQHAFNYETAEPFRGQRVLIVGAGNTGCDLAVEVSRVAAHTMLSLRRGYHFLPKFLWGTPIDRCGESIMKWRLPWFIYRAVAKGLLRIAVGPPTRYGLPIPDHKLFEAHPIINSQLLYELGHGRIAVKPDVMRLNGNEVHFEDGTSERVDTILCATGYEARFPFLEHLQEEPDLYLNVFDRERDDLFVIGLIQPNGAIWPLADYQSQLVARFINAVDRGDGSADWLRVVKRTQHHRSPFRYLQTDRHRLEVEYFSYRKELQRLLKRFDRCCDTPVTGN